MGDRSFWISVVGFPIAVLFIGSLFRLYKEAPQTSATDIFGLLIIFDAAVVGDASHFVKYIGATTQPIDLVWVMILLGFLAIVTWAFCLLELEPKLINWHIDGSTERPVLLFFTWLTIWSACLALIVTHVAVFSGRISI